MAGLGVAGTVKTAMHDSTTIVHTRLAEAPTGIVYALIGSVLFLLIFALPVMVTSFDIFDLQTYFHRKIKNSILTPVFFAIGSFLSFASFWLAGLWYIAAGLSVDGTTGAVTESLVPGGHGRNWYVAGIILYIVSHVFQVAWTPFFYAFANFYKATFVAFLAFASTTTTVFFFMMTDRISGYLMIAPAAFWAVLFGASVHLAFNYGGRYAHKEQRHQHRRVRDEEARRE